MKHSRITLFSLALMAGFCLQPRPLLAQDQDMGKPDTKDADSAPKKDADSAPKKDADAAPKMGAEAAPKMDVDSAPKMDTDAAPKMDADAAPHAAEVKPDALKEVQKENQQGEVSQGDKANSTIKADNTAGDDRSTDITKQESKVAKPSDKQTTQGQSQQKQSASIVVQGTQANHYNNQWVVASTHSDWDVSVNHSWNNHEYRYYDGGWLIITTSESPGYYQSDELVIKVKQSLAQQGYYTGHLTGTVGPHTRLAIANYESANGLQVNGEIDGPLLVSLGLE